MTKKMFNRVPITPITNANDSEDPSESMNLRQRYVNFNWRDRDFSLNVLEEELMDTLHWYCAYQSNHDFQGARLTIEANGKWRLVIVDGGEEEVWEG